MARNTPGPNAGTISDLLYQALVLAADGQASLAVTNTDGTAISGGGGGGGSTNVNLYTGQKTVTASAAQITASSHSLSNGMIVKCLSTNSAAIYVGLTGVLTTTGDAIEPGEARGYAVSNTNLLYIISVASTTDKITWSGN